MCLICNELIKQKMTWNEAYRASKEMIISESDYNKMKHYMDLRDALYTDNLEKLEEVLNNDINS